LKITTLSSLNSNRKEKKPFNDKWDCYGMQVKGLNIPFTSEKLTRWKMAFINHLD